MTGKKQGRSKILFECCQTIPSQHPFTARKLSLDFILNGTHSHPESTRLTLSEHSLIAVSVCSSSSLLQSALIDLRNQESFVTQWLPPRYYFLQHERCRHPEQTKRSCYYRTQKRCFHRFALSWTPE